MAGILQLFALKSGFLAKKSDENYSNNERTILADYYFIVKFQTQSNLSRC